MLGPIVEEYMRMTTACPTMTTTDNVNTMEHGTWNC